MPENDRGRPGEEAPHRSNGDEPRVSAASDTAVLTTPSPPMSKADRANLERLARKRAKVAKSMIGERVKVLRADVEDQLSAEYDYSDAAWIEVTKRAQRAVAEADAEVAAVCRRVGIPAEFRPSLSLAWDRRGGNAILSRRIELRRLAHARIDAAAESAKVTIESKLLDVETELIRDGLDSAEAVAYVASMPTPEQLLPAVVVGELEPGSSADQFEELRGRRGGWTPPQEAAGALLTPSSASNREQKRQAVAAALAADPDGSDRAIGRLAGVDHKTVAKLRGEGGEVPAESGEVPSDVDTERGGAR